MHVPRIARHVVSALHHLRDIRRDGLADLVVFGVNEEVPLRSPKRGISDQMDSFSLQKQMIFKRTNHLRERKITISRWQRPA